jgi:hypothetical protein
MRVKVREESSGIVSFTAELTKYACRGTYNHQRPRSEFLELRKLRELSKRVLNRKRFCARGLKAILSTTIVQPTRGPLIQAGRESTLAGAASDYFDQKIYLRVGFTLGVLKNPVSDGMDTQQS